MPSQARRAARQRAVPPRWQPGRLPIAPDSLFPLRAAGSVDYTGSTRTSPAQYIADFATKITNAHRVSAPAGRGGRSVNWARRSTLGRRGTYWRFLLPVPASLPVSAQLQPQLGPPNAGHNNLLLHPLLLRVQW